MARYALVDASGIVTNVIEADPPTSTEISALAVETDSQKVLDGLLALVKRTYVPPDGLQMIPDADGKASDGMKWDGSTFVALLKKSEVNND